MNSGRKNIKTGDDVPKAEYILVFGASVYGKEVSYALSQRLDKTFELYKISDINQAISNADTQDDDKYFDGANVRIGGIITARKTKTLKNGDTMAFVTVEDRIGEIVVIVFAKQYAKLSGELNVENAVVIEGRISAEEGEEPEIILSKLTTLDSNDNYRKESESASVVKKIVYVKLQRFEEQRLKPIYRLSDLYPGADDVVVYDSSSKKYIAIKNAHINSAKALERLAGSYGEENVVVKNAKT